METRRDVIVRMAMLADELGYEIFSVPEGWGFDSTALLTEIAIQTTRIRPMAGVLSVWGRTAGTIAMAAASLADVSNDRFILGLGASTKALVEGYHGVAFERPAGTLAENVREVRRLLAGERAEPPACLSARALRLGQAPRPDLPIVVAAMGPRAVKVAAEAADGWFPFYVARDGLQDWADSVRADRRAAGVANDITVLAGPNVAIDADRARAREDVAANLAWYMTAMGDVYANSARAEGYGDAVDLIRAANPKPSPKRGEVPAAAEALLEQTAVYGSAAEALAGLERWDAVTDVTMLNVRPGVPWPQIEAILRAGAPA